MATEIKLPSASETKAKINGFIYKIRPAHSEINLVPEVKDDMIKAIKLRNLTFFICIIIASASFAVTAVFASIAAGQQAIADGKNETITNLSKKLFSYSDLNNFLTIKDQLGNLSEISKNKTLLSRAFNILSAVIPNNGDTITVSALSINLSGSAPTIAFDAQADALQPPYIDYNVLESFKKSMQYLRYDYGSYVDRDGAAIPAYCIIEQDSGGTTLSDPERGVFAYWLIDGEGCNPSATQDDLESLSEDESSDEEAIESLKLATTISGYETETYEGETVVRIWRTPQFNEWYSEQGDSKISLSGDISGVAHFASKCTAYTGTKDEATGSVTWTASNESCLLVPEENGLRISSSSNGRDSSGNLVLRFSASITLSPEFFKFSNAHMLAVAPSGRYNVTDSYIQVQDIFGAPATDCSSSDTLCNNGNGGNNG